MVISRLRGGLGNQMFQYAFGRYASSKNGAGLKLDLSWFDGPGAANPRRRYALDIFTLDSHKAGVFETFMAKLFGKTIAQAGEKTPLEVRGHNLYLDGFWQSAAIVKAMDRELRNDFRFVSPIQDASKGLLEQIRSCQSVCVNVRRDDFVSDGKFVGVPYYEKAWKKMSGLRPEAKPFVFSDDIDWCKENINLPGSVFVGHEHAGREFGNYMQLMAACAHFIIPNSTFGWWAAWLSIGRDKIVVAPEIWTQDGTNRTPMLEIVPDGWLRA